MDLPVTSTPSPAHAQILRRRKKRLTPTNGAPGSSLSGLNRSSIRVVELIRGSSGYGFTISGQKPCLLRCIVEGSPAEFTGLQPGNCLVGVNGKDVSHLAHDDVVRLIGSCTGLLRLHVADSYFSESSDDESLKGNQQCRPRYPRSRVLSKSSLGLKKQGSSDVHYVKYDLHERIPASLQQQQQGLKSSRMGNSNCRKFNWDPVIDKTKIKRGPRPPLPVRDESSKTAMESYHKLERSKGSSSLPSPLGSNYRVESVRVFEDEFQKQLNQNACLGLNIEKENFESNEKFNTQSSSGSSAAGRYHIRKTTSNGSCSMSKSVENLSAIYHVVGYVGSLEICKVEEDKRLEALSACVRKLRLEKKVRSVVLLRIQHNGISLFNSSQNVQTGPPLAFYSYSIISFCGACNEDRRFFGLVTCTHPSKNSSCHVFMVEPKLLRHTDHCKRARAFGIQCNSLQVPKTGQILGLQECAEFPATADPILNSILQQRVENSTEDLSSLAQQSAPNSALRSPSVASNRVETNSSNSDSGIGFRDDCDRLSARIYDIVEPSLLIGPVQIKSSPVPKKRWPILHKQERENTVKFHSASNDFQCDSSSLREILGNTGQEPELVKPAVKPRRLLRDLVGDRLSLNSAPPRPPRPIEVSEFVTTSPHQNLEKRQRPSMELMTRISPNNMNQQCESALQNSQSRVTLSRIGTRSLDNLCSPEIFPEPCPAVLESKTGIGSSTPALYEKSTKSQSTDEIAEFKVPPVPKQKVMMDDRAEKWSESIEKLLNDSVGLEIFTEFLEREFSAENIHFYTTCLQFKGSFNELTQSQRISMCSEIFQRHIQSGANDPVNVDFQARCQVEKSLAQPSIEMFDVPLAQVFSLLKFDCYPRFLRSELYRDYCSGATTLPQSRDPSDSEPESGKPNKLQQNSRRRSLLPWHIKNRSKTKSRKNENDGLNSDISLIQRTAQNFDSSDQDEDYRRQSCKMCRIVLPDNSTTVLSSKPGESLCTVVQRLLEKREFRYSAFEVISVATGKPVDLTMDVTDLTAREIRVEPRAFIGIELPQGWKVGLRANPSRKVAEVLKSILAKHSLKLDGIVVYNMETDELVDLKWPIGKLDGYSLLVKSKNETNLDEITNQMQDFNSYEIIDDEQMSVKTSSSQSSSVFKEFLRRSSKKYKRAKGKPIIQQCESYDAGIRSEPDTPSGHPVSMGPTRFNDIPQDENSLPKHMIRPIPRSLENSNNNTSPLSLIPSELNLAENSRNRKPIYISQQSETTER